MWDPVDKGETWEIKMLDLSVFEKHWENIFDEKRQRKGFEITGFR